jgi:hypothetical protein
VSYNTISRHNRPTPTISNKVTFIALETTAKRVCPGTIIREAQTIRNLISFFTLYAFIIVIYFQTPWRVRGL